MLPFFALSACSAVKLTLLDAVGRTGYLQAVFLVERRGDILRLVCHGLAAQVVHFLRFWEGCAANPCHPEAYWLKEQGGE